MVLVEPKGFGFWTAFTKFLDSAVLKRGFISALDKQLYRVFNSGQDAMDHISHFYRNYHSMRFTRDQLSIRLRQTPNEKFLKEVNKKFSGLSQGKPIRLSTALPEESNEPELAKLPRLTLHFDRRDFGKLRALIDFINDKAV